MLAREHAKVASFVDRKTEMLISEREKIQIQVDNEQRHKQKKEK